MDFLKGLNAQQREAVSHTEGPLLILAGAGSGKTRVITHRIAHIITTRRVPPSAILAVTFTNKAAAEMRERVAALLQDVPLESSPNVSTFHSFCVRLLRRDGDPLARVRPGFTRRFSIYDDEDQVGLIKAAYRGLGLDEKEFIQYRAALSRISHAKNTKQSPQDLYKQAVNKESEALAAVFEEYEKSLRSANALDFDDLLLEAVRVLRIDDATRQAWNRRLNYVMIDEYQDTNRSQYELMRLLSESHKNVCVVGDEDQSIYSWRGADIKNILDFERDYPNSKTIRLEQNYRSTKNILAAAGAVVENNKARKGKKLWTESAEGELIGLYAAHDSENEALFIADTLEKYLASNPGDHAAVLYRTNSQSRQIEEALRRYGRKYNIVGGFSFYQRAEIKDIVAYLKLAASNVDSVSLLRIINTPARGIGRTTVEQIEKYARDHGINLWDAVERIIDDQHLSTRSQSALVLFRNLIQELSLVASTSPLPDLIRHILERTGYRRMLQQEKTPEAETRIENLEELTNAAAEAAERGETISDFLDHAALVAQADAFDEAAPITLMTLHNAKGLEFPVVFLSGMELGLFPHSRSMNSEELLEEERRLCYVGMTRARKRLYLSWAKFRRRFGGGEQERSTASWFLSEVPEHLIQDLNVRDEPGEVNLLGERHDVRQAAKRNTYTGKTYNSMDNISQFFGERNIPFNPNKTPPQPPPEPFSRPAAQRKPLTQAPPPVPKPARTGMRVEHPKYGTGTVVRREGDGDDAKITVNFPRFGLKKLVEKYAGLKRS
ncbi:MAG TPA: UvrD-helicase domain-containing protein [Candidatus Sulfopaludibacter sp.]|jgi:DNA helicase-2/ATP-dependent DNA helicase PcrA|nr:UvrD-helicase domain-containing protein [Candidatus Sulfopaludibacter sp.]